jgi:DNA repair exonuclease SbcCD ATPase subunit
VDLTKSNKQPESIYDEDIKQLKAKLSEIDKELRSLYKLFNMIAISETTQEELQVESEITKTYDRIVMLEERKSIIGGAGMNKICPCCGEELKEGYVENLHEEIKTLKDKLSELEQAKASITHETKDDPITNKINELEQKKEKIKGLMEEIKRLKEF